VWFPGRKNTDRSHYNVTSGAGGWLRSTPQSVVSRVRSILLALGQISSTSRAQSEEDIAKQFAGLWRLVSNPQRLVDGTMREGSNSLGYAFFDANAGGRVGIQKQDSHSSTAPAACGSEEEKPGRLRRPHKGNTSIEVRTGTFLKRLDGDGYADGYAGCVRHDNSLNSGEPRRQPAVGGATASKLRFTCEGVSA